MLRKIPILLSVLSDKVGQSTGKGQRTQGEKSIGFVSKPILYQLSPHEMSVRMT
jgi:hypothetical protein